MEARSQEPEWARAHALSKRLGSSSSSVNDLVWPYPGFGRGSDNTDKSSAIFRKPGFSGWAAVSKALGEAGNGGSPHLVGQYFYRSANDSVNR
jgi:hypothetical protein